MSKRTTLIGLCSAAALLLVGCAESGTSQQSQGGDTVTLYTTNNVEEMRDLASRAEEATGLNIDYLQLSTEEGWSRIMGEAPNFQADGQWGQFESNAIRAVEEGFLEPYDSPAWEDIPDQFRDPDGYWYGWSYWFNLITYNEDLLEAKGLDIPTSWADLTDEQYRGEIVLPDPGTSGTAFLFVATIMQIMGEEEAWDYFEAFHENVGQYESNGSAPAQLVGNGEYAIGITWDQAVFDRIDQGYPMEAVIPSEGVGYSLDVVWMFKDAANREGMEQLIDYIGSEEGMQNSANQRSMVTDPDVEGLSQVDDIEDYLLDYDAQWAAENQEEIMEQWRTTFGGDS